MFRTYAGAYRKFHLFAQMLCNRAGLKLGIGGTAAYSEGGRIQIPAFNPTDEGDVKLALRFIAHEVGHELNSDHDAFAQAGSPLERHITNVLEDVWQEAIECRTKNGLHSMLIDGLRVMQERGRLAVPAEGDHPAQILTRYMLLRLRVDLRGEVILQAEADAAETLFRKTFSPGVVAKVNALMRQCMSSECTADNVALARRIATVIKQEKDELEKQRNKKQEQQDADTCDSDSDDLNQPQDDSDADAADSCNDPDDSSSDQDNASNGGPDSDDTGTNDGSDDSAEDGENDEDCQGGSGDSDDGDDDVAADAEGTDDQGASGTADDHSEGTGGNESSDSNEADPDTIQQMIQLLQQTLEAGEEDAESELGEIARKALEGAAAKAAEEGMGLSVAEAFPYNGSDLRGSQQLSKVRAASNALRIRMAGLLQAETQGGTYIGRSGRHVSGRHLSRLAIGDPRVFAKEIEEERVDTAIFILGDASYSMSGRKIEITRDVLLACSNALDSLQGVSSASGIFPYQGDNVGVLKRFDERTPAAAHRFSFGVQGGTPLAPALMRAMIELAQRREPRKICIVVTDGEPDDFDIHCPETGKSAPLTRYALNLMRANGIEVIGVGIQTMVVNDLFDHVRVIDDLSQMSASMFELLRERLSMRRAA